MVTLRIAIVGCRGIPAGYGGFETFAEQLATRLVARGHQVTVYAEAEGQPPADAQYQGVHIRYRRRPHWGPASTLAYDSACLWDARKGYDIVYMLGYGAAWACWLLRLLGRRVWINVDGVEWARSKWSAPARCYLRLMEWCASRAATRVIADAQAIAQRYHSLYPQGAPCSCIAYGADVVETSDATLLAHWGLEPYRYLLVVARLEPENHIEEIIRGYLLHAESHPAAWPLIIVGQISGATPYQRRLQTWACERVRLLGGVYDAAQLRSLRLHAACYLHGHSVGGTNPSLLEALACGNGVLAHDNPYNREVCGAGLNACADYFSSPEELAQCLTRLEAPTPERSQRARQRITQHYTWAAIVDAYEALMRAECAKDTTCPASA